MQTQHSKPLSIIRTIEAGTFRSERPLEPRYRTLRHAIEDIRSAWGDDVGRVQSVRMSDRRRGVMVFSRSGDWRVTFLPAVAS